MDNYNSQSPYPYGNYVYPPVQPSSNQPFPPPNSGQYPPPASGPYPYPYLQYPRYPPPPYATPPAYAYPPPQSAPAAPPHPGATFEYRHQSPSHSGHLSYPYQGYPVPPTSSPESYNTQYGSSTTHSVPSGVNELPVLHRQDSSQSLASSASSFDHVSHSASSYPSVYPPIDDLLANVHLSIDHPSGSVPQPVKNPAAPASPSAPATHLAPGPPQKYHSGPLPKHNDQGTIYGFRNHSFSGGRLESPYPSSPNPNMYLDIPHHHNLQIVPVPSPKGSLKVLLLHGNLDIWVCEAKNLPNMDMFHKTLGDVFYRLPGNVNAKIEGHMSHKITSDPYVSIAVAGATIGRTYVISNNENPVWMQHFNVPVAHYVAEVHFVVKDNDVVGSQLIGTVSIPVEHIYGGGKVEGFFPILGNNGKPCKAGAVLSISIQYTPIERLSIYHLGVGAGPDYIGVPGTYFPLRRGGTVTLYQDAHVPDGYLPNLRLGNGMQYVHGKCWHDIFDAIRKARKLIYIAGWSVWHKVRLIRDVDSLASYTLGELLKSKSQEGVRVLLLVWDDPTSRSILGYKTVSGLAYMKG